MRSLLFAVMVLGCSSGSESSPGDDAGADIAVVTDTSTASDTTASDTTTPADSTPPDTAPDTAKPDTAKPDTAKPDAPRADAAGRCTTAADCKKYSSYCDTAPCQCLPLLATQSVPKCAGGMVACFADPCDGKTAACIEGECAIK